MDEHARPDPAEPAGTEPAGAEPQEGSGASLRDTAERLLLAGLGLVSTATDQARSAVGTPAETPPLKDRAQDALASLLDDLGFVTRERYEELELKVAQLEHRVRLLERAGTGSSAPTGAAPAAEPPAASEPPPSSV
jgi:hypothetical protein